MTEVPPPGPRQRLIDAATQLFYERGAAGTSVRDVTQACGVTPGALYNHFASKEQLLGEIVLEIHATLEANLARAQDAVAGDPVRELGTVVQVVVHRHARNKERARVANRDHSLLTGPLLAQVVAVRRRLLDRLAGIVRSGVDDGRFRLTDDLSPALVATSLFDMAIGVSEWFVEGAPFTSAQLARRYAVLALRMVGAAPDEDVLGPGQDWISRLDDDPPTTR